MSGVPMIPYDPAQAARDVFDETRLSGSVYWNELPPWMHKAFTTLAERAYAAGVADTWSDAAKIADDWPSECHADPTGETCCGPGLAEEFERLATALREPPREG